MSRRCAAFAAYCCDIRPSALQTGLDAVGVYFATGKPAGDNATAQACDLDKSSPTFGYETAFNNAVPKVVDCGVGDSTIAGTHYVYAMNVGNDTITLGTGLKYTLGGALSHDDAKQCADDAAFDATSSGGRASATMILLLLTLLVSR